MQNNFKKIIIKKKIFDFFIILLFAPILVTLFLILYLLVLISIGRPVIFKHQRPGVGGKIFTLYKFRTMTNSIDVDGQLLPDEERLTKFGLFLRSTSLDEIPEIYNVLIGQMSLIGPRPLLISYLKEYDNEQMKRHNLLPGITGLAQVNGRNQIDWTERFKLDVFYVKNWSLMLDIKILFLTIIKIISAKGVTPKNTKFMPGFKKK